jgi:hypothetical protein
MNLCRNCTTALTFGQALTEFENFCQIARFNFFYLDRQDV